MEKEFVPCDRALRLKAIGFDETCFGYRDGSGIVMIARTPHCFVSAPTFSQAFRWFREKYNLRNNIMDFIDDEKVIDWDYEIAEIGTDIDENGNYKSLIEYSIDDETRQFKTYEEAELACLDKLIEIIENQNK